VPCVSRECPDRSDASMTMDDDILLQRAQAGHRVSRQQLLLRQHTSLMRLVQSDLSDKLRAYLDPEDVLQEVYMELLKNFDSFRGEGPDTFRQWVQAVARNKVREVRRRHLDTVKRGAGVGRVQFAARFSHASAPLATAIEAHLTTVAGKAVRLEAIDSLAAALAVLPEHYRQVLELRYLLGLTVDEVAQRTKRSRGSVLMISHRGKQQAAELIRQFPLLTKS